MKSASCTLHRLYCVTVPNFFSCHYATSLNSSQWSYVYIHTYIHICMHTYIHKIYYKDYQHFTMHIHKSLPLSDVDTVIVVKYSKFVMLLSTYLQCITVHSFCLCYSRSLPTLGCPAMQHGRHFGSEFLETAVLWACRTASCRLAGESCRA